MSDLSILITFCAFLLIPCFVALLSSKEPEDQGLEVSGKGVAVRTRTVGAQVVSSSMQRRVAELARLERAGFAGA